MDAAHENKAAEEEMLEGAGDDEAHDNRNKNDGWMRAINHSFFFKVRGSMSVVEMFSSIGWVGRARLS